MSKNKVEPERPQMTIQRTRVAYWVSAATHMQSHVYALTHARAHTQALANRNM